MHQRFPIGEAERDAWLACMQLAVDEQPWEDEFKTYFMRAIAVPAERVRLAASRGARRRARLMGDEHTYLDDKLAKLGAAVREGNRDAAFDIYLGFDAALISYVRGEERLLFPVLERFTSIPTTATRSMRSEHRSLRKWSTRSGSYSPAATNPVGSTFCRSCEASSCFTSR